jgi:hypothetical protein
MQRLTGVSDYKPKFDVLAWMLMFAVFGALVLMHRDLSEARIERDKFYEAQTRAMQEITERLETRPVDVMREVQEIKRLVTGSQTARR